MALWLLLALAVASDAALAHGGGLNAEGCHTNRKTGDYHCHRGSGAPSGSRNAAPAPNPQVQPFVGGAGTSSRSKGSVTERLEELRKLRERGLISPEQYERKQAEILNDL